MMRAIDRRVIAMAFHECEVRLDSELGRYPFTISINLSGDTMSDDQFLDFLKGQFAQHRVRPEEICFEVTETAAIANLNQAVQLIKELRGMGCRFSLDD